MPARANRPPPSGQPVEPTTQPTTESVVERSPDPDDLDGLEPAGDGFVAGTMAELRKVVWPSRQQLFSESVAVILMVALSAAAIAAIDRFYGWLSNLVFR